MRISIILYASFSLAWLPSGFCQDVKLVLQGGRSVSGRILQLNNELVEFENGQQISKIDIQQLDHVQFPSSPLDSTTSSLVKLVDGSILNASSLESRNRTSQINVFGAAIVTENRNIHSVCFNTKPEIDERDQWSTIERSENSDLSADAMIVNRDGILNPLEGIIGDITAQSVHFSIGQRAADVNRQKIFGLVFYHASGRKLNNPLANVQLVDGSRLQTSALELEPDHLRVTTAAGIDVRVENHAILRIEFAALRSTYLSDLRPTTIQWQPVFDSPVARKLKPLKLPRFNTGYEDRPLQLRFFDGGSDPFVSENRRYQKGLAMSGGSRIAFPLEGSYLKLVGVVGFDPLVVPNGVVRLVIQADGDTRFNQLLQNSTTFPPREIDLDVSGCQRLLIKVDYADGRAIGDILNLCDLKVIK